MRWGSIPELHSEESHGVYIREPWIRLGSRQQERPSLLSLRINAALSTTTAVMHSPRFAPFATILLLGCISRLAAGEALLICIQDPWNLALSQFPAEATSYCGKLLDIPIVTKTIDTFTPVV